MLSMNKTKIITALCLIIAVSFIGINAYSATKEEFIDKYSHNNIKFYNPEECGSNNLTGECGGEITATDVEGRLREVVEKYGQLAMKLQEDTSVPWELVFAQMVQESGVGSCDNCVASHVAEQGAFNWMGMMFSDNHFYSLPEPYNSPNGRKWSMYSSIENMMGGYFIDYMRNGIYSEAFQYVQPDNLDIKAFFYAEIQHYCPASDGCDHDSYWNAMKWSIDIIDEVAKSKGWPTSAELAKQNNIPVGGKYPDVNSNIHKIAEFANVEPHSLNIECANNGGDDENGPTKGSKPADATLLSNHRTVTFYGSGADENGGYAGKVASDLNGSNLAPGMVAIKQSDPDLKFGDVIYIETTSDESKEGSYVNGKFFIVADTGAGNGGISGNNNIDVYHDPASENTSAPFGMSTNAKVYRVARGVTWDEYVSKYRGGGGGGSSDGSSGSGGQKQSVSVTWQDGWISSGFDGYTKEPASEYSKPVGDSAPQNDYDTKNAKSGSSPGPNKITLHNTEGTDQGGNSGLDLYNDDNGIFPAHFTINLKKKVVYQHQPITKPSSSIKSYDESAGIQIEIIGFSTEANKDSEWYILNRDIFKKEEWIYLAKLLVAIKQETGIDLKTSVDWENPSRLSPEEYKNYEGILAHMHAPAPNDHNDTGNIWPMLEEALKEVEVGKSSNCGGEKAWTGDFPWWAQCDERWANTDYGGCGNTCSSGCGVVSFAMMATALSGVEHLPDEVTTNAGNKGLHVCGEGSSHDLPLVLAPDYGLIAENIDGASIDQINAKLRSGYMIWTCGSGSNPFTSGGHCIGIRGITSDGKWLLADSAGERGRVNTLETEWDPSDVYPMMNNCKAIKKR